MQTAWFARDSQMHCSRDCDFCKCAPRIISNIFCHWTLLVCVLSFAVVSKFVPFRRVQILFDAMRLLSRRSVGAPTTRCP